MRDRAYRTILRIFILFLSVYAFATLLDAAATLTRTQRLLTAQQERAAALRTDNAALQYDIDHARDSECVERLVRERLGMVRPGERIEYDAGD